MRIDELIDGLIDPNAVEEIEELADSEDLDDVDDAEEEEDEEDGGSGGAQSASLIKLKAEGAGALRDPARSLRKDVRHPAEEGLPGQGLPEIPGAGLHRVDEHPVHCPHHRKAV